MTETVNPRQNVTFPSNGHQAHGYLALPPAGRGPGIVVIQEWWGLTDWLAGVCDRLAEQGFVALAPDLYGGRVTHDFDEAGELMSSLDFATAARDLGGAVQFLLGHEAVTSEQVGALGFCMGGGFVLALAAQEGDRVGAAVPFYGVVPPDFDGFQKIRAAVLGVVALQDGMTPPDAAHHVFDRIREGGAHVEVADYDGGHAFANSDNLLGTYDAAAADSAMERATAFLRQHVR